jgi:hypothetical protein
MCLGVKSFALARNGMFRKLGLQWVRWLGVYIAPNHFLAVGKGWWRWAHRTVRCDTGQQLCTIRCAPCQRNCYGSEQLTVGDVCLLAAQDSPVPNFCALTSVEALFTVERFCSRPLAPVSRCSAGSPNSPVAHWTVRWIIAEAALEFSRVAGLVGAWPSAPDSVWCAKNQHTWVIFAPNKLCP